MIALSNLYVAILDTCALAPMPLCDTLLRLAENPPSYIPKWSPDILREPCVTPIMWRSRLGCIRPNGG